MDNSQELLQKIRGFTDTESRVSHYPAKRSKQLLVLYYLAEKFQPGRQYTEKEVNELLCRWHTFGDWALLRRDLYDAGYLCRSADGSSYSVTRPLPDISLA